MGSEINDAERLMWQVVDACTDCDCCRYLMDTNCLFSIEDPSDGSVKEVQHRVLNKFFHGLLKDDGYFSGIDPLKRIKVAENTYDLGEYLLQLHRHGELDTQLGPAPGQMAYYPPCHPDGKPVDGKNKTAQSRSSDYRLFEFPPAVQPDQRLYG